MRLEASLPLRSISGVKDYYGEPIFQRVRPNPSRRVLENHDASLSAVSTRRARGDLPPREIILSVHLSLVRSIVTRLPPGSTSPSLTRMKSHASSVSKIKGTTSSAEKLLDHSFVGRRLLRALRHGDGGRAVLPARAGDRHLQMRQQYLTLKVLVRRNANMAEFHTFA